MRDELYRDWLAADDVSELGLTAEQITEFSERARKHTANHGWAEYKEAVALATPVDALVTQDVDYLLDWLERKNFGYPFDPNRMRAAIKHLLYDTTAERRGYQAATERAAKIADERWFLSGRPASENVAPLIRADSDAN